MKYVFVDEKVNEHSTGNLPVLLKEHEPFTNLKPEHARAYLEEGVIRPQGKSADEETIQNAIIEETKAESEPVEPLTEAGLKKLKKAALVSIAVSRSIPVIPDEETNAAIIKKILDTEPQEEK